MVDFVVLLNTIGAGEFLFKEERAGIKIKVSGAIIGDSWEISASVYSRSFAFGFNKNKMPIYTNKKLIVLDILMKALNIAAKMNEDVTDIKSIIKEWVSN